MANLKFDPEYVAEKFIDYGITECVGVPCSYLKDIISVFQGKQMYTEMCNEGDCIAYAAGKEMTGNRVLVLMQNSGLTNALSPLSSLIYPYKIPIRMMVGMRGDMYTNSCFDNIIDEPQHKIMPELSRNIIHTLDIQELSLGDIDSGAYFDKSFCMFIDKDDFKSLDLPETIGHSDSGISRFDVFDKINKIRNNTDIVITTTGFTSREMYDKFDNPGNFYVVGSMGCAISIGSGLAKSLPDRRVFVIDGDGAVKMRLSAVLSAYELRLPNLHHIILDNGMYESTGKQKVSSSDISELILGLIEASGYNRGITSFCTKEGLDDIEMNNDIYIVKIDSNLNDNKLGRPKESLEEFRNRFCDFLERN